MAFNRRDLLKFFAAGTVIAPVAGSEPLALARLIEVPKIEIVEAAKIPEPLNVSHIKSFNIHCEMVDGTRRTIHGGSVFTVTAQGTLLPEDRLSCDMWFARGNGSSPNSLLNQAFLAGSVYL